MNKKIWLGLIIAFFAFILICTSVLIISVAVKDNNASNADSALITEITFNNGINTATTEKIAEAETKYGEEWAYFLVNKENPLPPGYIDGIALEPVYKEFKLDARCAEYAREMLTAAEKDGIKLIVVSAYRSEEKQTQNISDYIERLIREGMSEEDAVKATAAQIAPAGRSEHNAAVAIDVLSEDWYVENDDITEAFELTPEFAWLNEHAWKYGFILRYGKDKTEITGFDYEPWHYRYIGQVRAAEIYGTGLSLEEYIELNGY